MRFDLSHEQELLRTTARAFLLDRCPPKDVRSLWDDTRGTCDTLWKDMAELGWVGLTIPEAYGGSGLGAVESAIVLEELGRVAYPGPYLPTVLAADALTIAGSEAQKQRWLPAIASGAVRGTVAFLDDDLNWTPQSPATTAETSVTGWLIHGSKRFVPWAHVADLLVIPARTTQGLSLFLLERSTPGLDLTTVTGMDRGTRWTAVRLHGAPVGADGALGALGGGQWLLERLLVRGAVGAAAEMLGAARRCFEMAVAYSKVREQFGQPIGAFQAVRHKCAEMLLEIENSHAATYYAAWALDAGAEDAAVAGSVAKAYVSDASRKVCGDALQVHGGIGFTWEYDLHLYFKRAKALEPMYGDADHHRELVIRHAESSLPELLESAPAGGGAHGTE